jgi:hypothetical protein
VAGSRLIVVRQPLIQSITTVRPFRRQTPLALLSMSLKASPFESSDAV